MRCPRTKHLMRLEQCDARKARRHPGCVTCTVPAQERRDQKQINRLYVSRDMRNAKPIINIVGLTSAPILITPRVAEALMAQLSGVV